MRKYPGLGQFTIIVMVIAVLMAIIFVVMWRQEVVERDAITPSPATKEQREIDKLAAEIKRIRSDTAGSLFWLKMTALFVTVGGAVGGYLVGQSKMARARIDFEDRKNVDTVYQSIVRELSEKPTLLRAAAAVKLGMILERFPAEWNVSDARREELVQLTKKVLAAALAIEEDDKVLKTLTIALARHRPWKDDPIMKDYADLKELDLSGAEAVDAYWARVDFSKADFYGAKLMKASFRKAILKGTQFREAKLNDAVMVDADCTDANFKLADLRGTDFTGAILKRANFEEASIYGAKLINAKLGNNPDVLVDNSEAGDGSEMINIQEWLTKNYTTQT